MSGTDIEARLRFFELDDRQRSLLRASRPILERCIGPALDRFYERARATPDTARFFRDKAHMEMARSAQIRHWMHIVDARFDATYHDSVRRIGSVHARIGLEPRWYIGAYSLILDEIIRAVDRAASPWQRLLARRRGGGEMTAALVKAALLDMELSISIYFEEAAIERNEAIAKLDGALARLALGDLAEDVRGLPQAFCSLEKSYNQTLSNLRDTIGSVVHASATIKGGSRDIADTSENLARRMESNAAALEQAAVTLGQVEDRVKATASGARETLSIADEALIAMGQGKAGAGDAVRTMHLVHESARGIDAVIEGVDKIAFQTRVLAMNAAVEAGRAGDAGRGFAVVADLVRALAMRAEEEARKAREGLLATQSEIAAAVGAVTRVDGALNGVSSKFERVHALIAQMSNDNAAQSNAITEVNSAVGVMDRATQQNASMIEKAAVGAQSLHDDAAQLAAQAGRFRIGAAKTMSR
ncbi:globin-coupled sensor protein [Sphingobium lactosutens]|uniref:globin-coupled sensor protein n=1 Tax=Sphingobium lactosutens TaxID=522773 RepID=UPI0015C0B84A|nr:globin-coupled sensor protein [Sphingobium lactosutens]